jgi:hypothetical protein
LETFHLKKPAAALFLRPLLEQGCQMVCFQTQNPNLGQFWRVLQWMMLVYVMTIWSILQPLEIVYGHLEYLWSFGIFFPVLVCCTKKNLATLFLKRNSVLELAKPDLCVLGWWFA